MREVIEAPGTTAQSSVKSLAEVAYLYYERGMNQESIAQSLGVSRPAVSRMLSQARVTGVVSISIQFPMRRRPDLEESLLKFGRQTRLTEVIVVEADDSVASPRSSSSRLAGVAREGARWLETKLSPGIQVGLSWGKTAEMVVEAVNHVRCEGSRVVQLAGEVSFEGVRPAYHLVRELAEKLGGNYDYLSVPAAAPNQDIARLLVSGTHLEESFSRAAQCDVAVLGVGAYGYGSSKGFLEFARATPTERQQAEERGVVGQMSSLFFDGGGSELNILLNERLFSVSLPQIRAIPQVAAVAAGPQKSEAVAAALRGNFITDLIVDEELAERILEGESS